MTDFDLSTVAGWRGPVSCDTETSSRVWYRAEVGVVSFAWGPNEGQSLATRNVAAAQQALQYRMDAGLPVVFHNSPFDLHVMQRRGLRINWRSVADTMILARLSNNLGDARLGALGESVLGIPTHKDAVRAWVSQANRLYKKKETWRSINGREATYLDAPDDILLPYAVQDARLTWMLYGPLYERVNPALYQREMELRRLMFDAETAGVEIDPDLTRQRMEQAQREQAAIEAQLQRMHGSPINLNSDPQLREWLYSDLGLTPVSETPGGQPQVNEFSLASNPHPATRLLRAYNKRVKGAEFFQSYLDLMDERCRLHPTINTMQARTHRFSASDPNLQQIPARNDRFHTREVFTAEGGWFVGADFDKQELRIGAEVAGDAALLADLTNGTDVYRAMAAAMLSKPIEQVTGGERQAAKVAVLSIIYGAGAAKVAESFTVNTGRPYTVDQARVIRDNWKAGYPDMARMMDTNQQQARNYGQVKNPWGRTLYVEHDRAYVATDYIIQSAGRDCLADALVNVDRVIRRHGGRIVMPIHDEIVCWVPERPHADLMREMSDAMTIRKFSQPLTATPKFGKTMAELK